MNLKKHLVSFKMCLLICAFLSVSQFIHAQTTVVGWDGPNFSYQIFDINNQIFHNPYANTGISANNGVSYIQTFGGVSPSTASDGYGDGNQIIFNAAPNTGWINGSGTKGYSFSFVSTGYSSLKFSGKFGGTTIASFKGARDFKLQYSLNNSTWTDVSNATVQAAGNTGATTSAIFNSMPEVTLPSDCDNKSIVYLRVIMTSNTSPDGQTATATGQTYIDDFKVTGTGSASPPVVLTCPTTTTVAACQTQSAVNTAFATWLATASGSGGTSGILTNNNTGAPSACGGSTTVTFTYTSTTVPLTTTCQATFTVTSAPTVVLTCPTNTTAAACQTQAAVNSSFATWLATATASGGCNGVLTNNNTGAPSASGGSTTVTFTYTSSCAPITTTCQATFSVTASPTVVLTCPTNTTAAACQTQAAVNSAFSTWLATASASGGCNGVLTNNNIGAPSACGGSTTVTFTYTSTTAPTTTTCQATFTVASAPTVVLTCPTNTTAAACQTQAAVNSSFATWLATATASGGCNGVLTNNNTGAPSASGGSTTVTFTYTSSCAPITTTCQATFTVAADTTPPSVTKGEISSSYPNVAAAEAAALSATSATDNCTGALTETVSTEGLCGSVVISVTTKDSLLNSSTVTYNTTIIIPTPTITAASATTFCLGGNVTLTSSPATSYLWSNGATTRSITVNTSGTFSVTVSDGICTSASSIETRVVVNPLANTPIITAGSTSNFCLGGSVTLTSTPSTTYKWSTGATTQSIVVSTSGLYSVIVNNGTCNSVASIGRRVTVNPIPRTPVITASGPTSFCAGRSVTLTSSSATGNLWSNGANTQSITVAASGTYSVSVTNLGCTSASSSETRVTVNPSPVRPTITASGSTTFCSGGSVTLTSSSQTGNLWSNGETTPSITVSTAGTYTVSTSNEGCSSTSSLGKTVLVNTLPPTPTISVIGSPILTVGGSVILTSSYSSANTWSTGAKTRSITVNTPGTYSVSFASATCTSAPSQSVRVTVNNQ